MKTTKGTTDDFIFSVSRNEVNQVVDSFIMLSTQSVYQYHSMIIVQTVHD